MGLRRWGGALHVPTPPGDGASGAIVKAPGVFYPGKSQKEGHDDQGEVKELGGDTRSFWPSFLLFPGLPGTPSWDVLSRR